VFPRQKSGIIGWGHLISPKVEDVIKCDERQRRK
jgi:hypothetical protein